MASAFDECGFSKINLENEGSTQPASATDDVTQASSENGNQPQSTPEDCTQSDDDDDEKSFVVFNGDLRCEHGLSFISLY